MAWVIAWLLLSLGVGWLAHLRERNGWYWGIASVVLSPLLAGVVLMMAKPPVSLETHYTITHDMELTHAKCPHCAEYVLPELTRCPYCKGPLEPNPQLIEERRAEKLAEEQGYEAQRRLNKMLSLGIVLGIALLIAILFTLPAMT